jgi:hypothetical protein
VAVLCSRVGDAGRGLRRLGCGALLLVILGVGPAAAQQAVATDMPASLRQRLEQQRAAAAAKAAKEAKEAEERAKAAEAKAAREEAAAEAKAARELAAAEARAAREAARTAGAGGAGEANVANAGNAARAASAASAANAAAARAGQPRPGEIPVGAPSAVPPAGPQSPMPSAPPSSPQPTPAAAAPDAGAVEPVVVAAKVEKCTTCKSTPRRRVAVLQARIAAITPDAGLNPDALALAASEQMEALLLARPATAVLGRSQIQGLLMAQDMAAQGGGAEAARNRVVPAELVLHLVFERIDVGLVAQADGRRVQAGLALQWRAHDALSNEPLAADTVRLADSVADAGADPAALAATGNALVRKLVDLSLRQVAERVGAVLDKVPFRGQVVRADRAGVVINAGKNFGLEAGDTFALRRIDLTLVDPATGRLLGGMGTLEGLIRVTEVGDQIARAVVIQSAGRLARGDLLEWVGVYK